jgi:hypothetical protein
MRRWTWRAGAAEAVADGSGRRSHPGGGNARRRLAGVAGAISNCHLAALAGAQAGGDE